MTDKELLYIRTIAEERTISAAAKKLFVTQPALSHCLSTLEKDVGTPLFIRTPGGLDMTYAGQCYYEMAVEILDIYNDYRQKISDISSMRRGNVRFGMTRYISSIIAPKVLPEFSRQYPNIDIHLEERTSNELEASVISRKLNFGVHHVMDESIGAKKGADSVDHDGRLYQQILSQDEFCVVLPEGHPAAAQATHLAGYTYPVLDPGCLEDEPFVLETKNHRMRNVADEIIRRVGICPKIRLETEMFTTALDLVKAGYGVSIINAYYLRSVSDLSGCRLYSIPKKYRPYWYLCIFRLAKGHMSFASQELYDMIVREEWS